MTSVHVPSRFTARARSRASTFARILGLLAPFASLQEARAKASRVPHALPKTEATEVTEVTAATAATVLPPSKPARQHTLHLKGALTPQAPRQLDVKTLESTFPRRVTVHAGPWQDEPPQVFEGVLVRDLVRTYAEPGVSSIHVVATNAYAETLVKDDWERFDALLAFRSNGQLISTRNRGTFRIVFDYLKHSKLERKVYDMKWVWQVASLEFRGAEKATMR